MGWDGMRDGLDGGKLLGGGGVLILYGRWTFNGTEV